MPIICYKSSSKWVTRAEQTAHTHTLNTRTGEYVLFRAKICFARLVQFFPRCLFSLFLHKMHARLLSAHTMNTPEKCAPQICSSHVIKFIYILLLLLLLLLLLSMVFAECSEMCSTVRLVK